MSTNAERRLLVVDDDVDFADSIVDLFAGLGYSVRAAASHLAALDVVHDFAPHVAIIDVKLGHTSGVDLLTPLRAGCPTTQCIMMTGYAAIDSVVESFRRDAVDYLYKPPDIAVLRATVEKCVAMARLIQARAEAFEALQRSEQRYRRLVENLRDEYFFYTTDRSRRTTYVSPSVKAVLGYTPLSLDDLWRPIDSEQSEVLERCHEGVLAGGSCPGHDVIAINADGGIRRLHIIESPAFDEHGVLIGADGIAHDVTERVESQERFRRLANASQEAIVIHDGARVLEGNEAFCALFGFAQGELPAIDVRTLWTLESKQLFEAMQRTPGQETVELDARPQVGATFPAAVRVRELPYLGRSVQVTSIVDLTLQRRAEQQRRQVEAQLRQSQKMEAIGLLVGGVAHDFNNILQGIVSNVAISSRQLQDGQHDGIPESLDQIRIASRRAGDLVAQLLLYSRGGKAESKPIAIGAVVEQTLTLLKSTLPRSVELVSEIDHRAVVLLDPTQLQQVLMNLCINARDALPDHTGNITVKLGETAIDGQCMSCGKPVAGSFVELSVADSGVGIPPHILRDIFDPFFTTKDIGKGTGMGLSVAHGIVHEHGGHILVSTAPSVGTTFRVVFPHTSNVAATDATIGVARPPSEVVQPRATGKLMVVDDEPMLAEWLAALLNDVGYDVTKFSDPMEALSRFIDDPQAWDLVITDHLMPRMTGERLAKAIVERRPDLPVVLWSGSSKEEPADRSSPIRAFMRKPVDVDQAIAMVARLLGTGR